MKSMVLFSKANKTLCFLSTWQRDRLLWVVSLLILLGISGSGESHGAKIYKWTDKHGVIHFSDRRPQDLDNVEGVIEERELKETDENRKEPNVPGKTFSRSPVEFAANCTFTIKGNGKLGSGFFLSSKGYAATCKHVIENTANPVVILNDRRELGMKVISTSHEHDLALILVMMPDKAPYLRSREPETLVPGERLFAIGSSVGLQATVTDGVFTGFRQIAATQEKVIQFSAPINPGNSGGPLIDEKGQLVGVVSSKYVVKEGMPVSGVGFALPSSLLEREFSEYISTEKE